VLEEARSQAIRQGNNYIVLFDFGAPGQVRVIDDDDNNWQQNGAEVTRLIRWDQGVRAGVTSYGNSGTPPAANVVPEDGVFGSTTHVRRNVVTSLSFGSGSIGLVGSFPVAGRLP
jgi:hypothetical protein